MKHQTYNKLNKEAMHLILKHTDKSCKWEKGSEEVVKKLRKKSELSVMDVPGLKGIAAKYHEANGAFRRKAKEEHQKIRNVP